MKQADLRVGHEYALLTPEIALDGPIAARVLLMSVDGRGLATVRVLDPGPKPAGRAVGMERASRSGKIQVTTRSIACVWGEWASRAAELNAQREMRTSALQRSYDDAERRRADRIVVEPNRKLPRDYDENGSDVRSEPRVDAAERDALARTYMTMRRLEPDTSPQQIRPLLAELPVPVLRDILAAGRHGRPGAAGTVASTFARAAELLEMARIGALEVTPGYGARRPTEVLTEADTAFVRAVQARVAAAGGELLLPPVPALPEWVDEEDREIVPAFGWLRVAVAVNGGRKKHAPGCRAARPAPVLSCVHLPWWLALLGDDRSTCGLCGGPGLRDLLAIAGFAAASDVWQARGCDRIEDWQQQALQRLIAVTAASRAQVLEPDITLAHRVVCALSANPPGEEGWNAYGLGAAAWWHRPAQTAQELEPEQREAALILLRERMNILESVLPEQLPPLAPAADTEELRGRYKELKKIVGARVPQLDRLMFTLPNAIWGL